MYAPSPSCHTHTIPLSLFLSLSLTHTHTHTNRHCRWEILAAGAIPILRTSGSNVTDSMFDDLPVLFVNDYMKLTRELLEKTWAEFQSREFKMEKLTARYWGDRIRNEAQCT